MESRSAEHPGQLYLFGVAVFAIFATTIYRTCLGPLSHLPGPWYTQWTNAVLKYKWIKGQKASYVHGLHQKYGPVVRISPYEADFCDIQAKQQIYTVKEVFLKSPWYQRLVGPYLNNVFSTQDPDFHRRHRRLLSSPLSERSLKVVEPIIRETINLTVQRAGEEMKKRGAADMFKWNLFMATDIIGELSFGESFRMLEKGEETQYSKDLETVARLSSIQAAFPLFIPLLIWTKFSVLVASLKPFTTAGRNLVQYSQQSLERYHRSVEKDPDNAKPTLLKNMLKGEEEDALSFDEIRDSAQAYIIAGSDTTAYTLTYLLWSVCKNPGIRERLVKEVQGLPENFTHNDTTDLPYLNQVIEETLRLYPPVPGGLPRIVPPEGATICDYFISGGMTVSTQSYSLHRNPEIFPHPEEFDPDRWATPTKAMKDSFLAFGGGARICIGLHLARTELRLGTALFFRQFPSSKIATVEGMCDDDMHPLSWFISSPAGQRCLVEAI